MATKRSLAYLNALWVTGYVPTQADFEDLFVSYPNLLNNSSLDGVESGITAHAGGGQGSAYALSKKYSFVSTVATNNDSVILPSALSGTVSVVYNGGTHGLAVFPNVGEGIFPLSANAAFTVPAGYYLMVTGQSAGNWNYQCFNLTGSVAPSALIQASNNALQPLCSLYTDYIFTALAANLTIGQPLNVFGSGQEICFLIKDNGTSRSLAWDASFAPLAYSLPISTIASSNMFLRFKYSSSVGLWYLIDYDVELVYDGKYKSYVALLSQSGTSAPTAIVLANTLGTTIAWTRSDEGDYTGTLGVASLLSKTGVFISGRHGSDTVFGATYSQDDSAVYVSTTAIDDPSSDGQLQHTLFELRVYP